MKVSFDKSFYKRLIRIKDKVVLEKVKLTILDAPYASNALGRKFLDTLPVSPEDFEQITHGNAERLLKL